MMSGEPILIVDDNPTNLKLIRILLTRKGYDIRTAKDANEALQILETFQPKIILMDVQLPGMDGLQLTRQLRMDSKFQETIIIAITAYAMKGDEEKAMAAGCNGYITKPIDTRTLPILLADYLGKKKETKDSTLKSEQKTSEKKTVATQVTIFMVEDNTSTIKIIKTTLENAQYHVIVAEDGQTALLEIKKCKPDLILLDMILPDMDGIELNRRLRRIPQLKEIPIIALTGFLTKFDNPDLINHSIFTDFLFKPIEKNHLLQMIQSYLAQVNLDYEDGSRGQHVFIIDDNVTQLKYLKLKLQKSGFKVGIASTSHQIINKIKASKPDIVISDVLMPKVDGFELCLQIRNDPQINNLPVILLTSHYLEAADYELAKKVGANAYLTRSTDVTQIIKAVDDCLISAAPVNTADALNLFKENHTHRLIRQLERQVNVNTGLAEQCALQAAQLSLLNGVTEALTSSDGIDNTIHDVLSTCLDAGGISKGMLFLINQNEQIVLRQAIGYEQREKDSLINFFARYPLLKLTSDTKKIIQIPSDDIDEETMRALFNSSDITSALIIPLVSGTNCIGMLYLCSKSINVTIGDPLSFARTLGVHIGQTIALASAFERMFISEQKHRILMDNATCGIFVDDLSGTIVDVNKRTELLLNCSKDEILGKNFKHFIHPEDRAFAMEQFTLFLQEGIIGPNEIRVQPRNASPRIVEYSGAIVKTLKEDLLLVVTNDVTERNQLRSQALLNDKLAAIGTLAAGIAHEVNNPISWVLSNLSYIKESIHQLQTCLFEDIKHSSLLTELDEVVKESIEGVERVSDIVRELKGFSRVNDDKLELVNVGEVLNTVIKIAFSEIKFRARLVKNIKKNLPAIKANGGKLHQVFLNLILNAAQSIEENSIVNNKIHIKATLENNTIRVDVADTGKGISDQDLSRIFEPFFTTKPIGSGTGLGLSICHDIIRNCGGEIKVHSKINKGSTFSVYLPINN